VHVHPQKLSKDSLEVSHSRKHFQTQYCIKKVHLCINTKVLFLLKVQDF
jgi:hypothetical protein